MISDFKDLTTNFKSHGITPGFHIKDNESSTVLKNTITIMDIKHELVHPSNHRSKNVEIAIHTFTNNIIMVL